MMNELRVLYAIYVPPGQIRTLLDAIRLFARPQTKHPAHITVRGPYPDYQDPRDWSVKVKGQPIDVGGVGTFFGPEQNTVFLRVDSPAVRAVWHKPDYPDEYNPHLTIYDGPSQPFAEALRDLLTGKEPRFTFLATGLEPMVLGNGPRPLIAWYDPSELTGFLALPPTLPELGAADEGTRLSWIGELAESLASATCEA